MAQELRGQPPLLPIWQRAAQARHGQGDLRVGHRTWARGRSSLGSQGCSLGKWGCNLGRCSCMVGGA